MSPVEIILLAATLYGLAASGYAAVQRFRAARTWRDRLNAAVDMAYVAVEGMKQSKKFGPMDAEREALDMVHDLLGAKQLAPADVLQARTRLKARAKGDKAPAAVRDLLQLREQRYSGR